MEGIKRGKGKQQRAKLAARDGEKTLRERRQMKGGNWAGE